MRRRIGGRAVEADVAGSRRFEDDQHDVPPGERAREVLQALTRGRRIRARPPVDGSGRSGHARNGRRDERAHGAAVQPACVDMRDAGVADGSHDSPDADRAHADRNRPPAKEPGQPGPDDRGHRQCRHIERRQVVRDRISEWAACRPDDRPRQRRREHARDRYVERDVEDGCRIQRPADPLTLQRCIDEEEDAGRQDVLPDVGGERPRRHRDVSADERNRLGGDQRRKQARGPQRRTRFSRLSSIHETVTLSPRALQIQSCTRTAGAGGCR